jgi:hypothetical protein
MIRKMSPVEDFFMRVVTFGRRSKSSRRPHSTDPSLTLGMTPLAERSLEKLQPREPAKQLLASPMPDNRQPGSEDGYLPALALATIWNCWVLTFSSPTQTSAR